MYLVQFWILDVDGWLVDILCSTAVMLKKHKTSIFDAFRPMFWNLRGFGFWFSSYQVSIETSIEYPMWILMCLLLVIIFWKRTSPPYSAFNIVHALLLFAIYFILFHYNFDPAPFVSTGKDFYKYALYALTEGPIILGNLLSMKMFFIVYFNPFYL